MKRAILILLCSALAAIAADGDGIWSLTYTTANGLKRASKLDLKTQGDQVTGTLSSDRGTANLVNGKISGNDIEFEVVRKSNNDEITVHFKGRIEGGTMTLTMQYGNRQPVAMTGTKGS